MVTAVRRSAEADGAEGMRGFPVALTSFVGRDLESWASGPKEERIPVKGVLRSMAEAMVQSAFTQPRAAVWVRVDATKTVELLESLKARPTMAGVRLSPLTITALAVCDAARNSFSLR